MQKSAQTVLVLGALIALGGCVAVPVAPAYYEPVPVIHGPVYYGPAVRFDVYGGGGHYRPHHHPRGHGGRRGYR